MVYRLVFSMLVTSMVGGAGCSMGSPASPTPNPWSDLSPGPSPDADVAGEWNTPFSYVAKVKNVLTGLPPTDDEVASVVGSADPDSRLRTLIQRWMTIVDPNSPDKTTYYAEKMLVFFELATQQTQINVTSFADQTYPGLIDANDLTTPWLLRNLTESFARTMVDQVVEGAQPLTRVATATTFMMTTALMEAYAFLDAWQVDDDGSGFDDFLRAHPLISLTAGSADVPVGESVDPSSPMFMHWTDPDLAPGGPYASANSKADCAVDPLTEPPTGIRLHYLLYGAVVGQVLPSGDACASFNGTNGAPQVGNAARGGANDFTDWRTVTVRQPMPGEATTAFYDLPALRAASTLVLNLPRVGFFTTPAFFANWPTNASNTMRVTANQTLVVALGAMVDGTDPTVAPPADGGALPPGLDEAHAAPGTVCYGCHQQLDPTRSILSSTYSWHYHAQDAAAVSAQKGEFAFRGVIGYPQTVFDLGNLLATHPLFAAAWTQKLCTYANSRPCETTDPELVRIVDDFRASGYSWSELVVDLFSSPLTTAAGATQTTTDQGVTVSVSRRDHLCAAMNHRLGFDDVCALLPTTAPVSPIIAQVAGGLPSDGYGRGAVDPVMPNAPTLFYRSGTENMCAELAALVIDAPPSGQPNARRWSSASPAQAIDDFTEVVAGLPQSDPRHDAVRSILTSHYEAALAQQGTTPTSALESAFVAACGTPSAVSIGF